MTKGIKRGKLPPIKTPSQLDVFVFGERKRELAKISQHIVNEISSQMMSPMTNSPITTNFNFLETDLAACLEDQEISVADLSRNNQ